MIIPDVNVLLYAVVDGYSHHDRARAWWERVVSGGEPVGLTPPAVFGFVRLATHRRVLATPMTVDQALGYITTWLERPGIEYLRPGRRHLHLVLDLLRDSGTAGNLTTDAQIAAHAVEQDGVVASNDTDFGRFSDVRWMNPLRD